MELSPYLQAIQKVTGRTLGEKNQTLHRIAKGIIENHENVHNPIEVHPSEELPEPLIPLVKLEIAKILKNPEGVIDALKSDDQTVFERALKVKWFFDGSIENYPNVDHFQSHILPYISLNHRIKFIKVLAANLAIKQLSAIAERFYDILSKMYGHNQARPLLKACNESFIWNKIENQKIVLTLDEVNYLYLKYPNIVIKYLKLQKKNENPYKNNQHKMFIDDYQSTFPKILKKNSKHFVELIRIFGTMGHSIKYHHSNLKLKYHHTNLFLKNETNALINDPQVFMPMLPLKQVMEKLTRPQLAELAKKYFPEKLEEFNFDTVFSYIFKHLPQDEKMPLMMLCFEEVYKKSLLDYTDKITPQAMRLLPRDERIKQARKKLENDKNWYTFSCGWDITKSWRCYLPTEESIPLIKDQISKTENMYERVALVQQLIYTCRMNDDKDALLEVLKYITTRHKNEREWTLMEMFDRLTTDFEIQFLPLEHWEVLYDFLLNTFNNIASEASFERIEDFWHMICCRVHFDLDHNRPIIDKIKLLTQINAKIPSRNKWNIIEEVPQYEKICLNEFIHSIPTVFFEHQQKNSYTWKDTVVEITKAMYDFNERNSKKTTNEFEKFLVKNYRWLLDAVKKLISDYPDNDNFDVDELITLLRSNEPDLLTDLQVTKKKKKVGINLAKALVTLHRDSEKILANWEKYYKKCKSDVYKKSARRFLKTCRWYQDIPAKFMEKAVEDVSENRDEQAIIVAAVLLDGSVFPTFIAPYLPEFKNSSTKEVSVNKHDPVLSSIATCLNIVNPPAPLDFILNFCKADYIHVILGCLLNQGRRVAVDKLLPLCEELISRRVSVRKHGVRILRIAASAEELRSILVNVWIEEKHRSIRPILVETMLNVFKTKPCSETWQMINECLDNLTTEDRNILDAIAQIDSAPSEYIVDYVRKLFIVFKKIGDTDNDFGRHGVWHHTEQLLRNLPVNGVALFPEEFHEEILKTYLIDLSLPKRILSVARSYLIKSYIEPAGNKLNDRLKVFSKIFIEIVKNHWDEPRPDDPTFCPANYFVHRLTEDIVINLSYSLIQSKLINTALSSFLSVLKPQEEPEFYCNFAIASLYDDKITSTEFTNKMNALLPSLVEIFSVEFMFFIAKFLYKLINKFYGENAQLDVIERLLEFNNDRANSLAAALLLNQNKQSGDDRFWRIFRALRKHRHPLAASSAYLAAHSFHNYRS